MPDMKRKTCCFTGHRDLPVNKIQEIAEQTAIQIRRLIVDKGVCFFGAGGAIGYDTLAAKVLFHIRENEFPYIKVILVYPFEGYTGRWTAEQKAEYQRLLPLYDKRVCVRAPAGREGYLARDRHLVNESAYCIAYCTRNYGGTAYTVRYAQQHGVEVRNIVL